MEIYHTVALQRDTNWTINRTAEDFKVSNGLVSENLRLAKEMHFNANLINCKSRMDALKKLERLK